MSASTADINDFSASFAPAPAPTQPARWHRHALSAASVGLKAVNTLLLGLILPVLLFALWWIATERHWVAEQILPPPAFVWDSFKEVLVSGELLGHVGFSAVRVAWSLLIGGSVGLLLGFGMGLSPTFKAYVFPTFDV
ncbi:MAG: ABC transporter permease, partial [Polaromonas sp.]|nr:ABC transporter permease [Polaromonas sp.]